MANAFDSEASIRNRIQALKIEHRDLDGSISALQTSECMDELQVRRIKKRKLFIKDEIVRLERELIPDIPA